MWRKQPACISYTYINYYHNIWGTFQTVHQLYLLSIDNIGHCDSCILLGSQDTSVNAEKVTPDAKISKACTSTTSLTSSAPSIARDDPVVCNLNQMLDGAAADPTEGRLIKHPGFGSHILSYIIPIYTQGCNLKRRTFRSWVCLKLYVSPR